MNPRAETSGTSSIARTGLQYATPLQNSLMELYGLISVIDTHVFGDPFSFRSQFIRTSNENIRNGELKERLDPICTRTLGKQVTEYIPFTRRVPITQDFVPSNAEQELYEKISTYLQREFLFALPTGQRQLITLILRKLLASSTFLIVATRPTREYFNCSVKSFIYLAASSAPAMKFSELLNQVLILNGGSPKSIKPAEPPLI